jgi:hypothetical protein
MASPLSVECLIIQLTLMPTRMSIVTNLSNNLINVDAKCGRTPNSLKNSNVSPSERQRKREESGRAP